MARVTRHAIFLLVAVLSAAGIYHLAITGQDRYSIFDLLRGRPVSAVIGQAGSPEKLQSEAPGPPGDIDLDSIDILARVNRALADVTEKVVPSVVSIDTTTTVNVPSYVPVDPFGFGFFGFRRSERRYRSPGLGSGMIVSEDGYILTNHHVVAGVDEIHIKTHTGEQYEAEWVGSDPSVDVAVLKIVPPEGVDAPEFHALEFGDSNQVRVGDMALAIGNPFGLSESVTRGIISAKQRQLSDGSNEYFQTDAVINPGNSGGPLVNIRGQIIGINTAIFTGQQDVRVWQGIGLALPSNDAREVFEAIVHEKPLLRGYLGLELSELSRYVAYQLGLRTTKGALVLAVAEDSPAKEAGLKPGDVIATFNGKEVTSAADTLRRIRRKESGDPVTLTIVRKGEVMELKSVIAEKPDAASLELRSDITSSGASGQSIAKELGITVRDLAKNEREAFGLDEDDPAVIISDVEPGSQAEQRFRPGDMIHAINRDPVRTRAEFFDLLGSLPRDEESVIILTRRGQRFYAVLNPRS
jgi:serine protease Do